MRTLLVIEDGTEYAEFAQLFLGKAFQILRAQTNQETLAILGSHPVDRLLVDLRFDRTPESALVGDWVGTAEKLFAGDHARALRHLRDQQGVLILAEIRRAGFRQPAVFIHDFPPRRLEALRRMYGPLQALPGFAAQALLSALEREEHPC
jgi:hypothetical protein